MSVFILFHSVLPFYLSRKFNNHRAQIAHIGLVKSARGKTRSRVRTFNPDTSYLQPFLDYLSGPVRPLAIVVILVAVLQVIRIFSYLLVIFVLTRFVLFAVLRLLENRSVRHYAALLPELLMLEPPVSRLKAPATGCRARAPCGPNGQLAHLAIQYAVVTAGIGAAANRKRELDRKSVV